jgi:gas vesicle protein
VSKDKKRPPAQQSISPVGTGPSAAHAAAKILSLQANSKPFREIQPETQAPASLAKSRTDYYRVKYEESRFESLESKLSANTATQFSELKSELKDEIRDYKDEHQKWALPIIIGNIVAITLGLIGYHIFAVKSMREDIIRDVKQIVTQEITAVKTSIEQIISNKKGKEPFKNNKT